MKFVAASDKPSRLLIVEDEAIVALDLENQLTAMGYEVAGTARTCAQAYQKAAELRPDLVLMDIHLEGSGDGIDAALEIRQKLAAPVVFLTAYVDAEHLERAKQVEPYGYLLKPFDQQVLNTTIQMALYKGQVDRELKRSHAALQSVLDAQRHATFIIDPAGFVRFVSRAATGWLDGEPQRAIGRPWNEVLPLDATALAAVAQTLGQPEAEREKVPATIEKAGAGQFSLEIEVRDDPQDPSGRILFVYDVSTVQGLRRLLDERAAFENMIGRSQVMQDVFRLVRDLAKVDSIVFIGGETGTGKELIAQAIHNRGPRSRKPFIAFNCAGLGEELAASLLFGHRRGSFTGAIDDHAGLFEAAEGGTLFLDEIGELPLRVQTTLLRALEQREIMRLGETHVRKVNVRVITASNRDLPHEVLEHRFRADLLYRIRIGRVQLPPLRERQEDIPLFIRQFINDQCATTGKQILEASDGALAILLEYPWPGNVRELKNAVEFAVIRARGPAIQPGDLPPEILDAVDTEVGPQPAVGERERILEAIRQAGGNRKIAAKALGISRATFYRRLTQLGIGDDA